MEQPSSTGSNLTRKGGPILAKVCPNVAKYIGSKRILSSTIFGQKQGASGTKFAQIQTKTRGQNCQKVDQSVNDFNLEQCSENVPITRAQ